MFDFVCFFDVFFILIVWLRIYNGMLMWYGLVVFIVVYYIGEIGDGCDLYIGFYL